MEKRHPIIEILSRWPSRQAITDDVNKMLPENERIDLIAVHRWHQRKSIPSKYDLALIEGASGRNITLNWRELMQARSASHDQLGHAHADVQAPDPQLQSGVE